MYIWLKLFQYFLGYVFVVSISWLLNAINCNLFVRVSRSNYQTLMKVTFLFWFCYNDESIVLETAVLSDDWGQSLCGWMDIECSNSSVSTTISGDRAASGAARDGTMGPNSLFPKPIFFPVFVLDGLGVAHHGLWVQFQHKTIVC